MYKYIIPLFIFVIISGVINAQQTVVKVSPAEMYLELSDIGEIFVEIENIDDCRAYSIHLTYDAQKVRCLNITEGTFFSNWNTFFFPSIDSISNLIMVDAAILGLGYQNGSGDLFNIQFLGLNEGDVNLNFEVADFRDTLNNVIPVQTEGGVIHIVNPTSIAALQSSENDNELRAYPNPFNSSTNIGFNINSLTEYELSIYNISGERVALQTSSHADGRNNTFLWNGKDSKGNNLPSGIYLIVLRTNNSFNTLKLIMLK